MISRKKCGMAFAMILGLGILAIDANAAPIDTGTTKIHFIYYMAIQMRFC